MFTVYLIDANKKIQENSKIQWMHNNETGAALNNYSYDEFGVLTSSTGTFDNPYTYSGYQYDSETKTYYLMARVYDPSTGTFLQEYSYRGNPNDPLSLNYYVYCKGNPLVYSDPTGHRYMAASGEVETDEERHDSFEEMKAANARTKAAEESTTSTTSYTPVTNLTLNSIVSKIKRSMTASLKDKASNYSEVRALTLVEQSKYDLHKALPYYPIVNIANDLSKATMEKDLLGYYNLNEEENQNAKVNTLVNLATLEMGGAASEFSAGSSYLNELSRIGEPGLLGNAMNYWGDFFKGGSGETSAAQNVSNSVLKIPKGGIAGEQKALPSGQPSVFIKNKMGKDEVPFAQEILNLRGEL